MAPPAANIEVNAVATGGVDVVLGTSVQLSNADAGGEITYAWTIVDQPPGIADALSNPAIENPTFPANKEGSYLVRLVVNAGLPTEVTDFAVVSVVDFRTGDRVPAAGELLERDAARGWATAVGRTLQRVGRMQGDPGLVAAVVTAGMSVGSVVRVFDTSTSIKVGYPGEELVPKTALLGAASAFGTIGIVIAVCDGGLIGAGKLAFVRTSGLVEFAEPGAPAVGAPVFVDDTGEPTLNPLVGCTRPRYIGHVVDITGGATYRWVIEGLETWAPRLAPSAFGYDAGADWTRVGGTSDRLAWSTAVLTSSRLIVPLPVNPGEVLFRVDAQISQSAGVALVNAYLSRGTATAGGGAIGNAVSSGAVVGAQVVNVAPVGGALVLPYTVPAGMSLWVGFVTSAAGAGTRQVGSVTAWVRPG